MGPEATRKLKEVFDRFDREMSNPETVEDFHRFLLDVRDTLYASPHGTRYHVKVDETGDGWHRYSVAVGDKVIAFNASPILGPAVARSLHHIFIDDFDMPS
jgi:hypothetical protein